MVGNRKIISFTIEDKVLRYKDDIWKDVQIMPITNEVQDFLNSLEKRATLLVRRGGFGKRKGEDLMKIADFIKESNSGNNLKEYEECKTDEDIVNLVRKDCKSKGLMEVK